MGKINVKFGYPISLEEQELLSEKAIERGCSIEAELCGGFEYLLNSLINRPGKDKFFDLIFLVITGKQAKSPKASSGTYFENGYKFPMIVLDDEYLGIGDSERLFISDEFINELGKIYQVECDYEYAGFERCRT
ncbi:hypothetical protein ICN19_00015 [Polynucleobacter sp. AP-Capit-er-40B-B4]|uniref:hypothetical protein n=1 Tax=Polynucleobacter sp. AP-Capit-er-40B-B4 TaxID=2576927 RepID=UPI001C0DA6CC|nr:hypothetical protein [Polynucleobacter sp. AP-Capit-er-40B-B4]MBU3580396.1 hypothetical protein [Polynucleobacter sp. AP-Capit-er-40B-B4]